MLEIMVLSSGSGCVLEYGESECQVVRMYASHSLGSESFPPLGSN